MEDERLGVYDPTGRFLDLAPFAWYGVCRVCENHELFFYGHMTAPWKLHHHSCHRKMHHFETVDGADPFVVRGIEWTP